jgi:hypothetical protein
MCESVFEMAGEQQGNGMGTAWERHGMCESALKGHSDIVISLNTHDIKINFLNKLH